MSTVASEIQQCEERIRQLQEIAERARFELAVEQAVLARLGTVSEASSHDVAVSARVSGSIVSRIEDLLIAAGGPVSVTAITEDLVKSGVSSESENGLKPSVASALSRRRDLFVKIGKGEYDLVSRRNGKEPHEEQHEQGR